MSGDWQDYEDLKKMCVKALRKAGHKAAKINLRNRSKDSLVEWQDVKEIKRSKVKYWDWVSQNASVDESGLFREDPRANPSALEDEEGDNND